MAQEPQGWQVQFRDTPLYAVPIGSVDVIECIKTFEAGGQNVYFTDEAGRYTGMAMPKSRFAYGWLKKEGMTRPFPPIKYEHIFQTGGVTAPHGRRKPRKSSAPSRIATRYRLRATDVSSRR